MCEHTDTKILDMCEHTDMKNLDLCRNSVSKVDSQTKKYPTADPLLAQTVDSLKKNHGNSKVDRHEKCSHSYS